MTTGEEYRITDVPAIDDMPAASNDGNKIAFTANRRGDLLFGFYTMDISKMEVGIPQETINPPIELVMPGNYQIYWPAWSPIGNWIAYSVRKGPDSFLEIINYDSLEWRRLNTGPRWNYSAYWAPKMNRLFVVNSDDGGIGEGSIIQQLDIEDGITKNPPINIMEESGIAIAHG